MDSLKSLIELEFPKIKLVDVGAMLTTDQTRYKKLLEKDLVNVIGFEADEDQYLKLQLQNKKNPEYLNYCLGDGSKKIFYITRYPGCSSLYEPNERVINLFTGISASEKGNFNVLNKKLVQTKRLDDIIEVKSTDLLKIDTQGSELEILKGLGEYFPLMMKIEAQIIPMYKNIPSWGELVNYLSKINYMTCEWIEIGRHITRAPAEMDMIFIPNHLTEFGKKIILSREKEFISLMLIFGHIKLLQNISTKLNFVANSEIQKLRDKFFN